MKKIGIISDTHGLLRPEIIEILKDCDCIIHAGDVNKPEILETLYFTIEGVKFFMTHNKKDVDWDLKDTQIVIFGHTHKYFEKIIDNRLWLNPGSCGPRRFDQEITMTVMTADNGTYQWEKVAMIPE